jgi:hypothetical protein
MRLPCKHSLSKNLYKLNLSSEQFDAFHTILLIGYRMAKFLSGDEIKELGIKDKAENLVAEWHSAAIELVVVMLRSQKVNIKD